MIVMMMVQDIKYVLDFLYTICLKHISSDKHSAVTTGTCAETHSGIHIKRSVFLPCFNRNWSVLTSFGKRAHCQIP
jgi:hypothetical protein